MTPVNTPQDPFHRCCSLLLLALLMTLGRSLAAHLAQSDG